MGLHCLVRPVCPNTYGEYSNETKKYAFMDKYEKYLHLTNLEPC